MIRTSLFIDYVNEAKDELGIQSIEVSQGCSSESDRMYASVKQKVNAFIDELSETLDVSVSELYEDYIALGNQAKKNRAQKIVDFLQLFKAVNANLRD